VAALIKITVAAQAQAFVFESPKVRVLTERHGSCACCLRKDQRQEAAIEPEGYPRAEARLHGLMEEDELAPRSRSMFRAIFGHLVAAAVSFILLQLPSVAQDPVKKDGHLFILSGQSNMTGGLKQGFVNATTKALGGGEATFVHCMRSGRGIRFWVEDYELPEEHALHGKLKSGNGEEYPRLIKAVRNVGDARKFKSVTLIWMQGESDAGRDLAVAYQKSFATLLTRLKADLGLQKIHFVIGRISDYGLHGDKADGWKRMRDVQVRLAESDPLGAWIDTDDLNGGDESNPGGELHYPNANYPRLGERFAKAALEQLEDDSSE
jgi:hypothetical protein